MRGGTWGRRALAVERQVGAGAGAWSEQGEVVAVSLTRHVVQRRGPEGELPLQIVHAHDDGTDTDHARNHTGSTKGTTISIIGPASRPTNLTVRAAA